MASPVTETPDLSGLADWPVVDETGDVIEVPALATWEGVELAAVGKWPLSTGVANFTAADFAQACAAARCPSVGVPVIKLGHRDPRFDGEPAIGWVAGMRLNETQTKIVGDFTAMPGWLAEILPSAYPERSIEGCWDFTCQQGHVHPFVITAVALLGVTPPGVGTIASLNDVAALYGVDLPAEPEPAQAGARPFRILTTEATMGQSPADAAGVVPTVDDIRRAYYEDADWSEWIVEVQLTSDGPVLIVIDDSDGDLKRVPVNLTGDATDHGPAVTFGPSSKVLVSYVDAPPDTGSDDGQDEGPPVEPAYPAAMAAVAAFPPGRKVAASWDSRKASRAGIAAKAIAAHSTGTGTGTWDGPANEASLSADDGAAQYRKAYAWVDPDGDADTKAAYKFVHHFVSADGTVGDASTVACSAGIGVLNGGRGGSSIPDDDVSGVYAHLSKHLEDSGQENIPELTASASTARAAEVSRELAQVCAELGRRNIPIPVAAGAVNLDAVIAAFGPAALPVDVGEVVSVQPGERTMQVGGGIIVGAGGILRGGEPAEVTLPAVGHDLGKPFPGRPGMAVKRHALVPGGPAGVRSSVPSVLCGGGGAHVVPGAVGRVTVLMVNLAPAGQERMEVNLSAMPVRTLDIPLRCKPPAAAASPFVVGCINPGDDAGGPAGHSTARPASRAGPPWKNQAQMPP